MLKVGKEYNDNEGARWIIVYKDEDKYLALRNKCIRWYNETGVCTSTNCSKFDLIIPTKTITRWYILRNSEDYGHESREAATLFAWVSAKIVPHTFTVPDED